MTKYNYDRTSIIAALLFATLAWATACSVTESGNNISSGDAWLIQVTGNEHYRSSDAQTNDEEGITDYVCYIGPCGATAVCGNDMEYREICRMDPDKGCYLCRCTRVGCPRIP